MEKDLLGTLFGNLDLEEYVQVSSKQRDLYLEKLNQLINSDESRLKFAVYSELRKQQLVPEDVDLNEILGLVMEVGVAQDKVDRVAAYADGRARYFSFDGKMIIWESQLFLMEQAIKNVLQSAKTMFANDISWTDSYQKNLQQGNIRFTVLTPNGYKVVEGEFSEVAKKGECQAVLKNAMQLIQLLKKHA